MQFIIPRRPDEGPPRDGFGFYGQNALFLMKKMYYTGSLLKMGLGSVLRALLPKLKDQVIPRTYRIYA